MDQLTKIINGWISDCIFLADIKWYKTMHWWMRTHLANTALQVDDWRRGEHPNIQTSECSNLRIFECSNFKKRNPWEKEEFGFSADLTILWTAESRLISILDLTSDLCRSRKEKYLRVGTPLTTFWAFVSKSYFVKATKIVAQLLENFKYDYKVLSSSSGIVTFSD